MKAFQGLSVWQKSHDLTLLVYAATRAFPKEELFGLTSQIRLSCASVAANIAEGCGRGSDSELRRFMQIAMGSASELEYHFLLAKDLNLLHSKTHDDLNNRVCGFKKMLTPFIKKLTAEN